MRSGPAAVGAESSKPPMRSATAAGCTPRDEAHGASVPSAPKSFSNAAARWPTDACGDEDAFLIGLGSVCMKTPTIITDVDAQPSAVA